MFTKKRKIFTAILSLILAVSISASPVCATGVDLCAVVNPDIEPQWTNVSSTSVNLSFDGAVIVISIRAYGKSGTTFSNGTITLTKLTGENIGPVIQWTNRSSSTSTFSFDNDDFSANSSGRYKLSFSIIATRNGVSETITGSKEATY